MEHQPTPEDIVEALENIAGVLQGTGRHAEHTQEQVGRCVYCSCGERVQGKLTKGK
jgi:hypothetical protein